MKIRVRSGAWWLATRASVADSLASCGGPGTSGSRDAAIVEPTPGDGGTLSDGGMSPAVCATTEGCPTGSSCFYAGRRYFDEIVTRPDATSWSTPAPVNATPTLASPWSVRAKNAVM